MSRQVTLLANDHTGYVSYTALHDKFIMYSSNELERWPTRNGIYQNVAVDTNRKSGTYKRVFILTGCIDNVALVFPTAMFDGLGKRILDGREVLFVEIILNELYDE